MIIMRRLLLGAAVLSTLSLVVSQQVKTNCDFYMLSIQWPPTTCSKAVRQDRFCVSSLPKGFTIHGFWPMYNPPKSAVPPYDEDKSCTNLTPVNVNKNQLANELKDIRTLLDSNWPSLYLNSKSQFPDNPLFWSHEWAAHGMCSEYPKNPELYFKNALNVFLNKYNNPFKDSNPKIKPGPKTIKAGAIVKAITDRFKKNPEIKCYKVTDSKTKKETLLLGEIRYCFEKPLPPGYDNYRLRDCPYTYDGRNCTSAENDVLYPEVPYSLNINEELQFEIIDDVLSSF